MNILGIARPLTSNAFVFFDNKLPAAKTCSFKNQF